MDRPEDAVLAALSHLGFGAAVLEGDRLVFRNDVSLRSGGGTGGSFLELIAPEERPRLMARLQRRYAEAPVPEHETVEIRLVDGTVRHLDIHAVALPGGRLVCVYRDATERERAGLERRQAEKVAALGRLVAGVAHDVNNPLSVLRCNHQLVRERVAAMDLPADARERFERLFDANERSVRRVAALMRRLQVLGSPQAVRRPPSDLVPVLIGVADDVRRHAVGCSVEVDLPVLPRVPCDAEVVGEAVRAILVNGTEAAPKGRVRLSASQVDGAVEVVVEDDGPGFTAEAFARRFEPFYSTKPSGNVGIGLTLARLVAENHGGSLVAENGASRGARLTMRLPLREA